MKTILALLIFNSLILATGACDTAPKKQAPQSTLQSDLAALDKPDQAAAAAAAPSTQAPSKDDDSALGDAIPAPKAGQSNVTALTRRQTPLTPTSISDSTPRA